MKPSFILLVFLQLCCLQIMVLVSMPTCRLPGRVVLNTHNHLRDLGNNFPFHCRPYKEKVRFPDSALPSGAGRSQCSRTSQLVYASLWGAELMFQNNVLPEGDDGVTWQNHELDKYLNLQYRLLEEYPCLNNTGASTILSPYFNNMTTLLEHQDTCVCGWESLRRDVLWILKSSLQKHRDCFNWTNAHTH